MTNILFKELKLCFADLGASSTTFYADFQTKKMKGNISFAGK